MSPRSHLRLILSLHMQFCDLHVSAEQIPRICSFLLQIPLISIPKMVLHLFGNYVFTFFDKSFSYTGFEVRKIILLCVQNTRIITILFIQKLSNHDNQINKTKIWIIVILLDLSPIMEYDMLQFLTLPKWKTWDSSKFCFWITVANILTAKFHVTSMFFGIRWIAVKSFLLGII